MPDKIDRDERNIKLFRDKPIQVPSEEIESVIDICKDFFFSSKSWFEENYEDDFIRYLANFRSIPGDTPKPWAEANDYYLPSTNITIENYLARMMETIRNARDFVTVLPRGKDDLKKSKTVELLLRYLFEQPMGGYQKSKQIIRNKLIYGTAIATMPYSYEIHKRKVPGTYLFDTSTNDYIREVPEESNVAPDETPPPKDFTDISISSLLNETIQRKDLYEDVVMKDSSDLNVEDILSVKVDPAGKADITKHQYTIFETIETIDCIKRKVSNNEYDEEQVEELVSYLQLTKEQKREIVEADFNQSISDRDNVEDIVEGSGIKGGVRIWTVYFKYDVNGDGWDEECIAVIAESQFLLKMIETPYQVNGIPYRPILVDKFIDLPHRFYGIGICEILNDLNFLLNHLTNQILNHGDLNNSPPLIYPTDGQWDPSQNLFGPGQTWQSDAADGFKILDTPDIKPSQINMITFVEGFIQKTLGINDFTLGSGSGSIVNNQTARGVGAIIREVNRRIDFYAKDSQEMFFKQMFEMILKQAQEFMDEAVISKVTDQDVEFSEIFNEDIQGFFDLKIHADSVSASKESEQQKWLAVLQTLGGLQDPNTGQPLFDNVEIGKRLFDAFGEPFSENFIAKNSPNPLGVLEGGGPEGQEQPQPQEAGLQEIG